MCKDDVVRKAAKISGLPYTTVYAAYDAILSVFRDTLSSEGEIILGGLGKLSAKKQLRKYNNFGKGVIEVEKLIVSFKPSRKFVG